MARQLFEASHASIATCAIGPIFKAQVVALPKELKNARRFRMLYTMDKSEKCADHVEDESRLSGDEKIVTWQMALQTMKAATAEGLEFRRQLTLALQNVPFPAMFWEMIPVTKATLASRPFEFVSVNSEALAGISVDSYTFKNKMTQSSPEEWPHSVSFHNLGGDARLIVPRIPSSSSSSSSSMDAFAHLASFLRRAAPEEVDELWRHVGTAVEEELAIRGDHPTWVSTSGLGVSYLHVRVDSRPKYYTYQPFKTWEA